jgi:hypothetical protein
MSELKKMRPITRPSTRVERVAKRLARDKDRQDRFARHAERPEASAAEATALQARITALTECHRIDYDPTDWAAVAARGLLERPSRSNVNEVAARRALTSYRPSFMDRLLSLEQDKRRVLVGRVAEAASKDEAAYRAARSVVDAHNAEVEFAMRLIELDVPSIEASLVKNTSLSAIGPAIEGLQIHVPTRGRLAVVVSGLDLDDMPDESCETGTAGKLVFRPMTRIAMAELHRRCIAAAALRVAAETLAAAPVEWVEVVMECDITDRVNGETQRARVLHVKVGHRALTDMDLQKADPVETIDRFGARYDWMGGDGFAPIDTPDLALPIAA